MNDGDAQSKFEHVLFIKRIISIHYDKSSRRNIRDELCVKKKRNLVKENLRTLCQNTKDSLSYRLRPFWKIFRCTLYRIELDLSKGGAEPTETNYYLKVRGIIKAESGYSSISNLNKFWTWAPSLFRLLFFGPRSFAHSTRILESFDLLLHSHSLGCVVIICRGRTEIFRLKTYIRNPSERVLVPCLVR